MAVLPGHCMGHHSYLVRHSEGASIPSVHYWGSLLSAGTDNPNCARWIYPEVAQADNIGCSDVKHTCWLQDVRQFYVLRFFLGCAEVHCCCNKTSVTCLCPLTCSMVHLRLQCLEGSQCVQGGTMPGMWYTLSLFFSGGFCLIPAYPKCQQLPGSACFPAAAQSQLHQHPLT